MGWGQTLGALRRRWYVLLIGAIATVGLGYVAWEATPPTYIARGTELLLPPASQVEIGTKNPLLELGGLEAPGALVIAQLNGQEAREQVAQLAPDAEYTVETDPALRGPTILVTMMDSTPEDALRTLRFVLDSVPQTLESIQSDLSVPAEATIGSMVLAMDSEPTPETSATMRTLVLAVGIGVVLTIGVAVGLDALLRRRAGRRTADAASVSPPSSEASASVAAEGETEEDATAEESPTTSRRQKGSGGSRSKTPA